MEDSLPNKAFGIVRLDNGKYAVVTVAFKYGELEAVVEDVRECDSKAIAVGDFKVMSARSFL
jgi:hypothetical protein